MAVVVIFSIASPYNPAVFTVGMPDLGTIVSSAVTTDQSAGTQITLTDKNGNTIVSYTPELSYAVVILSDPAIISGETYTITVGSQSGEFKAN